MNKFRFADGTRILGTIINPPTDFTKPVLVITDRPEHKLSDGQEELLEKIRQVNLPHLSEHRAWAAKHSDFYGEPWRLEDDLEYEQVEPRGVVITPKWRKDGVYDGQMAFPATFVKYCNLPKYYTTSEEHAVHAEFMLSPYWQRFADTPKLYNN